MAKISKTLQDTRQVLKEFTGLFYLEALLNEGDEKLQQFLFLFNDIKDSRIPSMCVYDTKTIIIIAFLAILDDRKTWKEIEDFGYDHRRFLIDYLHLGTDIPSHDTFCRVFSLLDTSTLQKVLVTFLQECVEKAAKSVLPCDTSKKQSKVLAMDGKEERGSGRKYDTDEKVRNAQIMHFYDTDTQICINSTLIDSKTNEIPTAQNVLKVLNIKGFIITADAMNAQKETVSIIKEKQAHYVLGLKGNHKEFHESIAKSFSEKEEKMKTKAGKNYFKMETEKNHNQVEIREFFLLAAGAFYQEDEWKGIKSIVHYKKSTFNVITGKENVENRYYISDLKDIETIAEAIRIHWGVENGLHWHLDTAFNEDDNSTMNKRALFNLSIMNKTVLTLMKLMSPLFRNGSIKRTQKSFRSNYETNMIRLFNFLDGTTIDDLFKNK